jgi:hypothetical protein
MKRPFRSKATAEPEPPSQPADTLSRIRLLTDDEERPSREDRSYGETIFTRPPVPLPRFLTGKRRSS